MLDLIFSDLALQEIPQLFQGSMLAGQDRTQGLVENIGDLLEAKSPVVPEIHDPLIRLGKLVHGLTKGLSILFSIGNLVLIDLDRPRHSDKFLFLHRTGMAFSPSHLVPEPVDCDPE